MLTVAASALLFAWWTGVAPAAAATGTLEICKAGANGTSVGGQPFTFTVQKGAQTPQTVTVTAPHCSDVTVPTGTITVTENLTSNGLDYQQVDATTVPESALFSENPNTAKTKITVNANDNIILTVTNQLAATSVKVCKTTATAQFDGAEYAFTIAGTPVTAIANGACSNTVAVQAGSVITVAETVPTNQQVTSVTAIGGTIKRNTGNGSVRYTVGNGVNVLTFNNEPIGPAQTGLLEVCKAAGDALVDPKQVFDFTLTIGTSAPAPIPGGLIAGQCTSAITVPAGNVLVTEAQNTQYQLDPLHPVTLGVNSAGALGTVNRQNGTAVVVVPVSTTPGNGQGNNEVQVIFTNVTPTTQLKVCKFLPAGSEALRGTPFTFDVTDDQFPAGTTLTVNVTVPAGASSACTIVGGLNPVPFPITSTATVTERNNRPFVDAGSGLGQPDTEKVRIVPGVNEIDFKNIAFGQLEVCKYMVGDDPSFGQTFTFNYVNTADRTIKGTVSTTAGTCTFPVAVPAGTYTVTEDLSKLFVKGADGTKVPVFQFVASDARGPFNDGRCVPPNGGPVPTPSTPPTAPGCGNPATVTVPFFNPADVSTGETQVSFWNRAVRSSVKICKMVTSDSTATLRNTTWTYTINTTNGFASPAGPLGNGQCTGDIGNFPVAVAGPGGTLVPNVVTVHENGAPQSPTWFVSGISVSGGYDVCYGTGACTGDVTSGTVNYHPGPGTNAVIFSNTAKPIVPAPAP